MGTIRAAKVATSPRLRKVLELLRARGPAGATTREIIRLCDVCAVNAIAGELRANGYSISCTSSVSKEGARIATYVLHENSAPVVLA